MQMSLHTLASGITSVCSNWAVLELTEGTQAWVVCLLELTEGTQAWVVCLLELTEGTQARIVMKHFYLIKVV